MRNKSFRRLDAQPSADTGSVAVLNTETTPPSDGHVPAIIVPNGRRRADLCRSPDFARDYKDLLCEADCSQSLPTARVRGKALANRAKMLSIGRQGRQPIRATARLALVPLPVGR